MAKHDLFLTQNVHETAGSVDFREKIINLGAYGLIAGTDEGDVTVIPKSDASGKILKCNDDTGEFSWSDNDGSAHPSFYFGGEGSDKMVVFSRYLGPAYAEKLYIKDGNNALIDIEVKGLQATHSAFAGTDIAPFIPAESGNNHALTTKKYVDDKIVAGFAANDAMVMKGSINASGVITSKDAGINGKTFGAADFNTYSAGWVILVANTPSAAIAGFTLEEGDKLIAITDVSNASNGSTPPFTFKASDWRVIQGNIVGAITMDNPGSTNFTNGGLVIGAGTNKTVKPLANGTTGKVLKMGASVPEWGDDIGFDNPMSAVGDLIIGGASGAATRLPKGAQGKVLKVGAVTLEWGDDTSYTHPNHSGDVTSVGDGPTTISAGAVTLSKMANLSANTIIGNDTGDAATPKALTKGEVSKMLHRTAAPTYYDSPGSEGEIRIDNHYVYFCAVGGTLGTARWKRTPIASNWSMSGAG